MIHSFKFKTITSVLMAGMLAFSLGCGKDNNTDPNQDPGNNNQPGLVEGTPHTYQFTITGGHYDGQTFSGEFKNPEDHGGGNSVIFLDNDPNGLIRISFFLSNDEHVVGGEWLYDPDNQTTAGLTVNPVWSGSASGSDSSYLDITFQNAEVGTYRNYQSTAGTVTVSEVKRNRNKVDGGLLSCKATFSGTFRSLGQDSDVQVSGTFKFEMQPEAQH